MTCKTSRTLSAILSCALILAAPGPEAFAAAAAVVQQRAAVSPASGQVGTFRPLGAASIGTALQPLGTLSLQGSLSLTPVPGVKTPVAVSAPALDAAPALLPQAAPAALPAAEPAPIQTTLGGLSRGVERIETGARQDAPPTEQRQAVDELFLGRGLRAPADVSASPLPSRPSGLQPAARQGDPRTEPAEPERSISRSLRVGWLGAVIPLAFTILTTTVAQLLGYQLHPGYQGPAPSILTPATVAATFGMAAVLAPVSEEIVFRSGLMGGIRKLTRRIPLLGEFWIPALVSSAIFVALHELSDPLLFFTRMVHSLILSWAWHKEGLPSSIAAHAFFNGLLTLPMVFSLLPGPGPIIAGLLTAALGIVYTWRSIKALKAQRADRASGEVMPFEISSKQALALAGVLIAGYYLLAHNPIWFLGAMGYGWYALKHR